MEFRLHAPALGGWSPSRTEPMTAAGQGAPASADDLRGAEEAVLVEAFQQGRVEAFDAIVERHQRTIYHLCYRFTGNHEDAADLAQDVFVRVFRGLGRFKGTSTLSTWLHRVAVNTALNRRALKKLVTSPIEAADLRDGRLTDPGEQIDSTRRAALVRAAIDGLPPKQRATVILRVYHELPYEEIAQSLGTTVGAAKANIFHALGKLKRVLRP